MLKNLSLNGCALSSKEELEVGTRIRLTLPPRNNPPVVTAEVLETKRQAKGFYPFFHRCRFIGVDATTQSKINIQVMRYQRDSIQADEE